jgi:hypothetical protein
MGLHESILEGVEEAFGGQGKARRAARQEDHQDMRQLSREDKKKVRQDMRETLREQGYHPGRRQATMMIPGVGPIANLASKKYRQAKQVARHQALEDRFGAIGDEVCEEYGFQPGAAIPDLRGTWDERLRASGVSLTAGFCVPASEIEKAKRAIADGEAPELQFIPMTVRGSKCFLITEMPKAQSY